MAVNRVLRALLVVVLAVVVLPAPATAATTAADYSVINVYPHDSTAWTEGLAFYRSQLYESTGLTGHSSIRRVDLATGTVLQKRDLCCVFGEGVTLMGGKAWMLTWKDNRAFLFDAVSFAKLGRFYYSGEGWGLTNDGTNLVMSNGTSTIRFRDPTTFTTLRSINVTENGTPVSELNSLAWINGQIWANIWLVPNILIIDPATGHVVRRLDFSALQNQETALGGRDMNGIAYWKRYDRIFVTGKFWHHVYEIRLNAP